MAFYAFHVRAKCVCWRTHIEAWQCGGLGQEAHRRGHGLWRNAFHRWPKMFEKEVGQKLE